MHPKFTKLFCQVLMTIFSTVPTLLAAPVLVQTIDFSGAGGSPGMRFGDITGDGRLEMIVGQPMPQSDFDSHTPQEVGRVTAYSIVTGKQLWQYTRPGNPKLGTSASSDVPIQVYDWDGDGVSEVIAAFSRTEFTFLDGLTGKVKRTIPIPQGTSARGASGSNDCVIIANLRGTPWPQDFIVKTRYTQVWGIDGRDGKVLWGPFKGTGDNLAHFGYVYDVDGDGRDEYLSGHQLHSPTGEVLWKVSGLQLHLDAAAIGDIDGDPTNGKEFVLGSNIGACVRGRTGEVLWRDTKSGTVEIQQMGVGDFLPNRPGLETVVLDRIGPRDNSGIDANVLLSSTGALIWREKPDPASGWVTVTEKLSNWDGTGKDFIFSYRRTSAGPAIFEATEDKQVMVAEFKRMSYDIGMHANLCGDDKEEVVIYDTRQALVYANGGCDLEAPMAPQPQNRRHYNWSIYTGWEDKDYTFFTPGQTSLIKQYTPKIRFHIQQGNGLVQFKDLQPSSSLKIWDTRGTLVSQSGIIHSGEWVTERKLKQGVYLIQATQGSQTAFRKLAVK
ncbi:MAG: PQQ-binding-like beta-propeller repeat protein [Fibrobacteria bacterium]